MTSVPSSELRDRIALLDVDPLTAEQFDALRDLFLATLTQHTDLRVDQQHAVADLVLPQLIELGAVGAALARAQADLQQARQQTEAARCRLHHIQARVEQITDQDLAIGIGLDLMPWLDGPLHPDHLAAYRATQPTT